MIAPNWEDLDAKANPIINYFADRQHTEVIIKKNQNDHYKDMLL